MRGARALAVRLRPRRRNGPHVGQRVHPYHACHALPSHHQDASFTTSAALYSCTVASRRRHVPGAAGRPHDRHRLAQVPDAQRCSHDPAIHRPRARSSRVQHVARRQPAACPTEPAKPIETVLGQTPVEDGAKSLERLAALGRLRGPDGLDHADDILAGDGVHATLPERPEDVAAPKRLHEHSGAALGPPAAIRGQRRLGGVPEQRLDVVGSGEGVTAVEPGGPAVGPKRSPGPRRASAGAIRRARGRR